MTSPTGVRAGSSPRFTTRRTTSRSETTPTRRSPSSTMTMPMLRAVMTSVATFTVASRWSANKNPGRMMSRSVVIPNPPGRSGLREMCRVTEASGRGLRVRVAAGRARELEHGTVEHRRGATDVAGRLAWSERVLVGEPALVDACHQHLTALAHEQEPAAPRAHLHRAAGYRDVVGV